METITYSRVENLDIQLDLYLPTELRQGLIPAIVHFHSGGMIAGCRKTLALQQWLKGKPIQPSLKYAVARKKVDSWINTLTPDPRRSTRGGSAIHQRRPSPPIPIHRL